MNINYQSIVSRAIEKRVFAFQSSGSLCTTNRKNPISPGFGQILADGGVRHFQLTSEHLGYLFIVLNNNPAILNKSLIVARVLTQKSLGSFRALSEVCQISQQDMLDSELNEKLRHGILQLLLFEINMRLQTLYKLYYRFSFPDYKNNVDDLLTTSEVGLEETAYEFLREFDLPFMLEWLGYEGKGEVLDTILQRLSNFFFQVDRVNLRFTYHCNLTCRHCYNSSGPDLKNVRIPLERMRYIIEQMPLVGIRKLNITGGEPFLYLSDIISLVSFARDHGITQISIFTNASWAIDSDRTRKILLSLKESGFGMSLDFIKASAGVYHQEFVSVERVLLLAEEYFSIFEQPLHIDFESPNENNLEEIKMRNLLEARNLTEKVIIKFRGIAPLGRGQFLRDIQEPLPLSHSACTSINQLVFDPDGSVRPCCGLNADNFGIIIGKSHKLVELVKSLQNNPILQFLASRPIDEIFPYSEVPIERYVSKCDACQAAIGSLKDTKSLRRKLIAYQELFPFWFNRTKLFGD